MSHAPAASARPSAAAGTSFRRRRASDWRRWCALLAVLAPAPSCAGPAAVVGRAGGGAFSHLAADGDRLLANDGATLFVFDLADPRQPRELGRLESPEVMSAMAFVDGVPYVEVGIRFRGLETDAESIDQQWIRRGWLSIDERSYSQGVFVGVSNLARLDLADPARPVVVPLENLTPDDTLASRLRRMVAAGRYLYASEDTRGTLIFDVTEPRAPRRVARLARGLAMAPAPPYLYLADGAGVIVSDRHGQEVLPGGLQVIDLSEPGTPGDLGILDGEALGRGGEGANADRVAVSGRHAYLGIAIVKGGGWGGADEFLVTVDVADPARPREVRREKLASGIEDLTAVGKTLYARLNSGKLAVYSLADPARPRLERTLTLPGEVLTTLVAEPWLYVGSYEGLAIVDLRR